MKSNPVPILSIGVFDDIPDHSSKTPRTLSPSGSEARDNGPWSRKPRVLLYATQETQKDYLEGPSLLLVMIALLLSVLLPALDQFILTTAIPRIVSQFDSLDEISWIPNAYFLTIASFLLIYGQIINLAPLKTMMMTSIIIFEAGSLLCGLAPGMNFLILGRAVAGVGAAGSFVCVYAAIDQIAPIEKRPKLIGLTGAMFGVSSILGPLVGGALTEHATWRWCFFMNLPIGGLAAVIIYFLLPNGCAPPQPANRQGWRALLGVDYVGAVLLLGMKVAFLYPLVRGGNAHPWNSAVIISLFISSGALLGLFLAWSWYRGSEALFRVRLLTNRTVMGASMTGFFIWMAMVLGAVYLTTWYQAVKGHSPLRSGVDLLPLCLVVSVFTVFSGIFVGKTSRYRHLLVVMPLFSALAAGLEFTIKESTSEIKLAGYQILWGISIGMTIQLPVLAVQAAHSDDLMDTHYVTSLATFIGFLGRMFGVGLGSALFTNKLFGYLPVYAPQAPFQLVLHSVDVTWQLPVEVRSGVIHAYVLSMRYIFIIGVPAGALATLSALFISNNKLPAKYVVPAADARADQEARGEVVNLTKMMRMEPSAIIKPHPRLYPHVYYSTRKEGSILSMISNDADVTWRK